MCVSLAFVGGGGGSGEENMLAFGVKVSTAFVGWEGGLVARTTPTCLGLG